MHPIADAPLGTQPPPCLLRSRPFAGSSKFAGVLRRAFADAFFWYTFLILFSIPVFFSGHAAPFVADFDVRQM